MGPNTTSLNLCICVFASSPKSCVLLYLARATFGYYISYSKLRDVWQPAVITFPLATTQPPHWHGPGEQCHWFTLGETNLRPNILSEDSGSILTYAATYGYGWSSGKLHLTILYLCYHFPASVPAITLTGAGESAGVKNGIILAGCWRHGPALRWWRWDGRHCRQFKLIMAKQSH